MKVKFYLLILTCYVILLNEFFLSSLWVLVQSRYIKDRATKCEDKIQDEKDPIWKMDTFPLKMSLRSSSLIGDRVSSLAFTISKAAFSSQADLTHCRIVRPTTWTVPGWGYPVLRDMTAVCRRNSSLSWTNGVWNHLILSGSSKYSNRRRSPFTL